MMPYIKLIEELDLTQLNEASFLRRSVGCLVLTQDSKILLQQRGSDWSSFPGCLSTFGGGIEPGESPLQALVRELKEELGADVAESEVIALGVITEAVTQYTELVYVYFWQDKQGRITNCYEGEAKVYATVEAVLIQPKLMDYVRWLLKEGRQRKLL